MRRPALELLALLSTLSTLHVDSSEAYCNKPTTTVGYDLADCNSTIERAGWNPACGICSVGYTGFVSHKVCGSAGGAWSVSGCQAHCNKPTTIGYDLAACASTIVQAGWNPSCGSCSVGYTGSVSHTVCSSAGVAWSVSGCQAHCNKPDTTGYDLAACASTILQSDFTDWNPECGICSLGYKGGVSHTVCGLAGDAWSVSGCEATCETHTCPNNRIMQNHRSIVSGMTLEEKDETCCEEWLCPEEHCKSCVDEEDRMSNSHCATCNLGELNPSESGCEAYECLTGRGGGLCRTCVEMRKRRSDKHCSTCFDGYNLIGTRCEAESSHWIRRGSVRRRNTCQRLETADASCYFCEEDQNAHAVTCCSDTEITSPTWKTAKDDGKGINANTEVCADVWRERDQWPTKTNCPGDLNPYPTCCVLPWQNASDWCISQGARLCTDQEIEDECAIGSGCGFDGEMLWSADPCKGCVTSIRGCKTCVDPLLRVTDEDCASYAWEMAGTILDSELMTDQNSISGRFTVELHCFGSHEEKRNVREVPSWPQLSGKANEARRKAILDLDAPREEVILNLDTREVDTVRGRKSQAENPARQKDSISLDDPPNEASQRAARIFQAEAQHGTLPTQVRHQMLAEENDDDVSSATSKSLLVESRRPSTQTPISPSTQILAAQIVPPVTKPNEGEVDNAPTKVSIDIDPCGDVPTDVPSERSQSEVWPAASTQPRAETGTRAPTAPASMQPSAGFGLSEATLQSSASASSANRSLAGLRPTTSLQSDVSTSRQVSKERISESQQVREELLRKQDAFAYSQVVANGREKLAARLVTHWWGNKFYSTIAAALADALDEPFYESIYALLCANEFDVLRLRLADKGKLDACYWICPFSVNQHAVHCHKDYMGSCNCTVPKAADIKAEDRECDKFDYMMRYMKHAAIELHEEQSSVAPERLAQVIACDEKFECLNRIWCVAEFVEADISQIEQTLKIPRPEALKCALEKISNFDVEQSDATMKEDKALILNKIDDKDAFNDKLRFLVLRKVRNLSYVGFCMSFIGEYLDMLSFFCSE